MASGRLRNSDDDDDDDDKNESSGNNDLVLTQGEHCSQYLACDVQSSQPAHFIDKTTEVLRR